MSSVMNYLQALEATLKNCDPNTGGNPDRRAHRFVTVYKYSLLYLISTKKIKFTDSEEKFIDFMNTHPPLHHLKVANAYLKKNKKPLIQWEVQHAVH